MTNNDTGIKVGDPYGSIKAAMSRGLTQYYDETNGRKAQIIKKPERKTNGTR